MTTETTEHLVARIQDLAEGLPTVRVMEVCGTHTVALFRHGIRSLLPSNVKLISGPGCPVCVTTQGYLDAACDLALRPDITVCTYGDMVRVPGHAGSLADARGKGAKVRVVTSARDALTHAAAHSDEQVVFLAVGFETTAPATALTALAAKAQGVHNLTFLLGHKLVLPAMMALLAAGEVPLDGFLCPGHVSVITGMELYRPIVETHGKPCVVAGFEVTQILKGLARILESVRAGEAVLDNVYPVAVSATGNPTALAMLDRAFVPTDTRWRAMGSIPASGYAFREDLAEYDAAARFGLDVEDDYDPPGCRCGEVIQGKVEPRECPLFATACTPLKPVGPCMVSSEGTCAAWYKYARA